MTTSKTFNNTVVSLITVGVMIAVCVGLFFIFNGVAVHASIR